MSDHQNGVDQKCAPVKTGLFQNENPSKQPRLKMSARQKSCGGSLGGRIARRRKGGLDGREARQRVAQRPVGASGAFGREICGGVVCNPA